MMHSEQIGDIAQALSKAQAEIKGASKDALNPHFKSKYANLESVWDACREPLSKNGLSIIQTIHREPEELILKTILAHCSGQWFVSCIPILASLGTGRQDMQALGSAITYARRYGLAAIVGVSPSDDDDDGEASVGRAPQKQVQRPTLIKQPPSAYQEIINLIKIISDNFQNKECLKGLSDKFGSSKDIKEFPVEKQGEILSELKIIFTESKQ